MSDSGTSTFTTSIDIDASPATVFEYLVTNDGMTAWMGQYADLDPRPGGRFAVDIAGRPIRGEFIVVDPPSRLVVSWGMPGSSDLPPGASTVEFTLSEVDHGRTRVVLNHRDLPAERVEGHRDGWQHFTERLAIVGTGGDAGHDRWVPLPDRHDTNGTAHRPAGPSHHLPATPRSTP